MYPYDSTYEPIANIPIVTGATAYTDPDTGQTYILVFNESLYYGTRLPHSLFNQNQIRQSGIDLWENPYDKSHELSIDVSDELIVPLRMQGTKLVFESRVPTPEELSTCLLIQMTSSRVWEPASVQLGKIHKQVQNKNVILSYDGENPLMGDTRVNTCIKTVFSPWMRRFYMMWNHL